MKPHDYQKFAKTYAQLGIKDTYYLAYRDIPQLIKKHVKGKKALDFGCGGGRSTRFLKEFGLNVIGVDSSKDMINEAEQNDPEGKYIHIQNNKLPFEDSTFDLIVSCIVFIEIPSKEEMEQILNEMKRVMKDNGIILVVVHRDDIYEREWASFIWKQPQSELMSGQKVKVTIRGTNMELYDYHWTNQDYLNVFANAKLNLLETIKPVAKGDEPFKWASETKFPYWNIYVLTK